MPPVVMRDYRAQHELIIGGTTASQGSCAIHLDDTFLLVKGDRTNRIGYESVESIQPLPGGLVINMYPEGSVRFGGMDGALVRPLFLHLSRLRATRWADLLRFVEGDPLDSIECKVRLGEGAENEGLARVYPSGVVVMPFGGDPVQLPIQDLTAIRMEPTYRLIMAGDGVFVGLYGTEPSDLGRFHRSVEAARRQAEEETAALLTELFPALEFAQLSRLTELLLRGRAAPKSALDSVIPWIWDRIEELIRTSARTRDSYAYLRKRGGDRLWFGVRRLTAAEKIEDGEEGEGGEGTEPEGGERPAGEQEGADPSEPEAQRDYIFWFMAGIESGTKRSLAVEVVSGRSGFATYVYRCPTATGVADPFSAAAGTVSKAMLALNFFREPLSAPQKDIDFGKFAEYKLAVRKLTYLREARQLFLGRAIHSSLPAWTKRVEDLVSQG